MTIHKRYTGLDRRANVVQRATLANDIPAIPMRVLKALQLGMDEDGTRPGLHGIYFEVSDERTVFLSATNGHCLIVVELGEPSLARIGMEGMAGLICGESVRDHIKSKGFTPLQLSDAEYPDVRTVVPDMLDKLDWWKAGTPPPLLGLNGKYVDLFGRVLRHLGRTKMNSPIVMHQTGPLSPMLFTHEADPDNKSVPGFKGMIFLLMPMRLD